MVGDGSCELERGLLVAGSQLMPTQRAEAA